MGVFFGRHTGIRGRTGKIRSFGTEYGKCEVYDGLHSSE
jgi:hypothetical protein